MIEQRIFVACLTLYM